ncbi:uncharacterized protein METZ01_LOCUS288267 [marine metagenome]|uniref:Uncharacterized protein n=1 Tax=marine metagenome TaxID=408172 RepID=A0A382LGV0_9ZZZZ
MWITDGFSQISQGTHDHRKVLDVNVSTEEQDG